MFVQLFLNSLFVATGTTLLVLVVGTLGAYGLTRFRFPGAELGAGTILFTYFLPLDHHRHPDLPHHQPARACRHAGRPHYRLHRYFRPALRALDAATVLPDPADRGGGGRAGRWRIQARAVLRDRSASGTAWHHRHQPFHLHHRLQRDLFSFIFINSDARKTLPVGINFIVKTSYEIEWNCSTWQQPSS